MDFNLRKPARWVDLWRLSGAEHKKLDAKTTTVVAMPYVNFVSILKQKQPTHYPHCRRRH